ACPRDFITIGDECFKIINSLSTWDEANAICRNLSLVLSEPRNPSSLATYISFISGTDSNYWIGGRGNGTIFMWQSGALIPNDWELWRPGHPESNENSYCLL
ncbi:unnamed protein product, partial [Meganyctiphanes norvegica]